MIFIGTKPNGEPDELVSVVESGGESDHGPEPCVDSDKLQPPPPTMLEFHQPLQPLQEEQHPVS